MSIRNDATFLRDIVDAIDAVLDYMVGYDYGAFRTDRETIDAVIRNIEKIGEANKRITEPV